MSVEGSFHKVSFCQERTTCSLMSFSMSGFVIDAFLSSFRLDIVALLAVGKKLVQSSTACFFESLVENYRRVEPI